MKSYLNTPDPAGFRWGMGAFLPETPATDASKRLFRPLSPRNPLFPALGDAPTAVSGASRQKQTPASSQEPNANSKFLAIQDFNREGESAFLPRAGYDSAAVDGLSTYALGVFGTEPDQTGEFRQDEYDLNLQWAPTNGTLKGLSLRLRDAFVQQDGGDDDSPTDFRVI